MSDPDLAMDDPRDSSSRFVIQSMVNIFVCNQAGKRFNAMILKQRAITPKSYLYFAIFAFTIISINQLLFFAFKTENLYEKINLPRKLSLSEVKKHGDELAIELMKKQMPADEKIRKINEISEIISVLSHPARRLTYDSFGLTST